MISITCTNCRAVLTIDDAFAGGVCRCQHCGTIQTVPINAAEMAGVGGGGVTGQSLGGSKVSVPRDRSIPGSGLDELGDIVASSGLTGSGLTSRRLSRSTPAAAPKSKLVPVVAMAALAGALVGGIILFVVMGKSAGTAGDDGSGPGGDRGSSVATDGGNAPVAASRGPSYCGEAFPPDTGLVLYVLDRGSGSRDVFDGLKSAAMRSIRSLGAERKFQVIFWDNGVDQLIFPPTGPAYATEKRVEECRKLFDDIAAFGATDPKPALQKAYAAEPDVLVVATGKGGDLDADLPSLAVGSRKGKSGKTFTFSLGEGESDVLRRVAESTNGAYRHVTAAQLSTFGE